MNPDPMTLPLPLSTASMSVAPPSVGLVRKLVSVMEAVEKLPVYTHDAPGQVLNLQVRHSTSSSSSSLTCSRHCELCSQMLHLYTITCTV